MKIIIAGSRDITSYSLIEGWVDALTAKQDVIEIVSGAARGVDLLGERWAKASSKATLKRFPAKWDELGKRAGFIRNVEMAKYADGLIAFWDSDSRGTIDMIKQMYLRDKPVRVVTRTGILHDVDVDQLCVSN